MTEKKYADFNNYPICGDTKYFIELLASIAARVNNTQEKENDENEQL